MAALQEIPTLRVLDFSAEERRDEVGAIPLPRRGDELTLEDRIRRVRRRARFLGRMPLREEASDLFEHEEFLAHFGSERSDIRASQTGSPGVSVDEEAV